MQQQLFGTANENLAKKKELAIVKQGDKVLTKQQKEFNRLVKKIEKLRSDVSKTVTTLDSHLKYYGTHIHPLEQKMVTLRTTGVKLLFPYYTGEKRFLSQNEKDTLLEIICGSMEEIFYFNHNPDDELKAIYETINGENYDEEKKEAFEEMKSELEDQMKAAGFDMDLDGIDEHTPQEEIMRKVKEMQEEFARQAENMAEKNANRKKTKKELAQEEREKQIEEARKKSIGSIYKQLVKAFHPDLETDPAMKLQKEDIMKQLTVAYEKNDLHTLLRLELEWIQEENNDPAKLSNDKLAIYNEALKEQAEELEMQIDALEQHPRYMPLNRLGQRPSRLSHKHLSHEKTRMEDIVDSLETDELKMKGNNPVHYIKDLIRFYKTNTAPVDDFDKMLKELLKGMK